MFRTIDSLSIHLLGTALRGVGVEQRYLEFQVRREMKAQVPEEQEEGTQLGQHGGTGSPRLPLSVRGRKSALPSKVVLSTADNIYAN